MSFSADDQSRATPTDRGWLGSRFERLGLIRLGLSLIVAVVLIVPESEIRAKLFKANLIVHGIMKARR